MPLSRKSIFRIKKLITFAETLPPEAEQHFEMRFWFSHDGDHQPKLSKSGFLTRQALWDCGSKACMLGWAAAVSGFYKAGLRIWPALVGVDNLNRAQAFFDLSHDQTERLFGCGYFDTMRAQTPKQWAAAARALLSTWSIS